MRLKIISEDNRTNVYTWLNFIKTFSVTFPGNFLGAGSHKSMLIKFDIWRIITVYNSGNHHHSSVRAGTIFYTIAVILSFAKYKVSTNDLMKDFITKQIHDVKYNPNGVFTRGLPCQPPATEMKTNLISSIMYLYCKKDFHFSFNKYIYD